MKAEAYEIGNLDLTWASELAHAYGYAKFLGGSYSWSDWEKSGREEVGKPPETFSGGKMIGNSRLPQYLWHDKEQDILAVIVGESYGCGQSSSAYYSK